MQKLIKLLICLALLSSNLQAQSRQSSIAYQGYLSNGENLPVDGIKTLTFRLYSSQDEQGQSVWSETISVQVMKGYFHVDLGHMLHFQNKSLR